MVRGNNEIAGQIVNTSGLNQQREVVIAFLALERYLTSGGVDAIETQDAFRALQRTYRGPSVNVLDRFSSLTSHRAAGEWLARLRVVLEGEIDAAIWIEVARREQVLGQTEEPRERLPASRPDNRHPERHASRITKRPEEAQDESQQDQSGG